MAQAVSISVGSALLGVVFGIGGYIFYRIARKFGKLENYDVQSLRGAFLWAFLAWAFYEVSIFARFFFEYVVQVPVYTAFTLSLTSRITENPFIYGINPLGFAVINPLQAAVTWSLELGAAFLTLVIAGFLEGD